MDDEISVVHQDPLCGVKAFYAHGELTHLFQPFRDFVRYCLSLSRIRYRTDDEVIGEGCDVSQIEDFEIYGFLGFGCAASHLPVFKFLDGLPGGDLTGQSRCGCLLP